MNVVDAISVGVANLVTNPTFVVTGFLHFHTVMVYCKQRPEWLLLQIFREKLDVEKSHGKAAIFHALQRI